MKKQALINAIEAYCQSKNTSDLTIDNIVEYLAESGTTLKWVLVNEVSKLFSLRKQRGPRMINVENDSTIKVLSDDQDNDIRELSSIALRLVKDVFEDQNVKFRALSDNCGFEISIESLEGL